MDQSLICTLRKKMFKRLVRNKRNGALVYCQGTYTNFYAQVNLKFWSR